MRFKAITSFQYFFLCSALFLPSCNLCYGITRHNGHSWPRNTAEHKGHNGVGNSVCKHLYRPTNTHKNQFKAAIFEKNEKKQHQDGQNAQ